MAMGKKRERQQEFWIATKDVAESPRNAFYDRLNEVLEAHKFDRKVEALCRKFYKKSPYGRPSMAPGVNVTGFEVTGEIDRRNFGVNFEGTLENGSLVVGNKIGIEIAVEAHQAA